MTSGDPAADLRIQPATPGDVPLLLTFVKELAEYERLTDEVVATEDVLRESLFGPRPAAEALIAYRGNEPVAFAIWFYNFSSFLGRPGLYIEDIYVRPHARGQGVGQAILVHLAHLARQRNCGRMEWVVLDWNEPAISFYKTFGARPMDGWTVFGLTASDIDRLADGGQE